MSNGHNSPGISRLAGVMADMARNAHDPSLSIDFGVIQNDKSLLTNTFPIAIPATDYLVCRSCALPNTEKAASDYASYPEPHKHTVNIARPSQRCLKAGDRVLVVWVYNDAVVVDIIKSASEVFGNGDGSND